MTYNIIADIAGRYNELEKLVQIMPPADKIILVGDLMDRGPDSRKVVEWAMNTPNVITIKGNHEDMMVKAFLGDYMNHTYNGGNATLKSYGVSYPNEYPVSHIDWMQKLPVFYEDTGLFVSHAPWIVSLKKTLPDSNGDEWEVMILWNREAPSKDNDVYQVFGHNSRLKYYGDYAVCIDDSGKKQLTGMHWPSKKIYQVEYEKN